MRLPGQQGLRSGRPVHLYGEDSRAAKRDERLASSGRLLRFSFEGHDVALEPKTAFYDWLYVSALVADGHVSALRAWTAFTDIEFNPARSINCQARSCALAVALDRRGRLDEAMSSFERFVVAA